MDVLNTKLYGVTELKAKAALSDFNKEKYYHGTTDKFEIEKLLPPYVTGELREVFREKFLDKVFVTDSLLSAEKFAKKAADKFGGNGIVYEVKPFGEIENTIDSEYICDWAEIVSIAEKYDNGWH